MSSTEDRDLLRRLEMIARVKPSTESTQRAMDRVRMRILTGSLGKEAPGPRIIRWIPSNPVVRVAIAACIAIAVTLAVVVHRPQPGARPIARSTSDSDVTGPVTAPEVRSVAQDLQAQLRQVDALSAVRDVDGLMGMLDRGLFDARVAAAQRLAQIGDPRPVETLARLADQWKGDPAGNPFALAIQKIQGRTAAVQLAAEANAAGTPTGVETPTKVAGSRPALSGLVTDSQTGQPIAGADIQIIGPQVYLAQTGEDGSYRLDAVGQAGDYHLLVRSLRYVALDPQDPCAVVVLGPDSSVVQNLQLKRGCQINVEVVDEEGRPIKDVRLAASWLGSDQSNDVGQPALTSQDGEAVVGALNPSEIAYQIAATSQEYAPQRTVVTCSDPNVVDHAQMTLHKGGPIRGYAQYSDGTPAQGLQIYALPDWWHSDTLPPASAVDAAGGFVLGQIQAGTFDIRASIPQENGLAYSLAVTQAQLPPAGDQPLVVTIPRQAPETLASISGTIRWPGNQRPETIDVMAYCLTGTITRGRLPGNGDTFALTALKPGTYTLVFEGANVEEKVIEGVLAPRSDLEVSLQYVPTPRLRGIVLKARSGEPVQGFKVAMMKIRSWPGLVYLPETQWHPVSDPNGVFDLLTEGPGLYQVQVSAEGFVTAVFNRVDTGKARQLVVELSSGGRIQGRGVNAAGEPISGAGVVPLADDQAAPSLPRGLPVREQACVQTQEDGQFVLEHVPAGLHGLRVTHPQFSTATLEGIAVMDGETSEAVTVTLRSGGTVEGTVFDAQGQAQANVTLTVQSGDAPYGLGSDAPGLLATAVTDDQGHYRIEHLPATLCLVQRRNADAHLGVVRRAVWPGEGGTIRLDLGGRPKVTGILALDGQPTAQCLVLLADAANPNSATFQCRAITESDGSFVFNGVPGGRYAVYCQPPAEGTRWIKVATVDEAAEDLDLGTVPGTLARVVVTLAGLTASSVTDWTLYLREGDAFSGQKIGEVTAPEDVNKPYEITQVLPGSYTLVARSPDGSRQIAKAVEVGVQQTRLDVTIEIPSGTGTVSGAVLNEVGGTLFLFSQDRTLSVRIDGSGGYYRITGLSAGDYFVGNPYLLDKAPLAQFHLADGENKILDIDTWKWSGANQGLLSVQVVSTLGRPLNAAAVWLEGSFGRIDPLIKTDREQVLIAPAGPATLHVSQPGFQSQQRQVQIQANNLLALVPLRPVIQIVLEPELSPSNEP